MDARMQKHRMACWLRWLFVLLFLMSWDSQAAVESVPGTVLWCNPSEMANDHVYNALGTAGCTYPTALGAAQAYAVVKNAISMRANIFYVFDSYKYDQGYPKCHYYSYVGTVIFREGFTIFPVAIGCPVPTVNPAVKYSSSFDGVMVICKRPAQENLTITLSGGSEVEPSKGSAINTLPFIATVIDQNTNQPPNHAVTILISLKVDPASGGHDHGDNTRPRGGIANVGTCPSDATCWSETSPANNGVVVFNFNAPEASGTHTISATCDGCSNTATKTVDVKVDGLKPIPAFSYYALNEANGNVIGARSGWHTDNHNLTHAAAQKLMKIASWYRFLPQFKVVVDKKTGRKDLPPVLHVNDASLPWGGVYDICARPDACPDEGVIAWQKPHAEHRRGTVVDVRANGDDGSIPASNKAKFLKLLQEKKMSYLHESRGTSNEHFHLRLMGNKE